MPGIFTHNRLFRESLLSFSKRKKKNYLLRSVETLFSSDMAFKAGLFGSIGPNIFDYIPRRNKNNPYCHDLSFAIHNGGSEKYIKAMAAHIFFMQDKNTEWSSLQRAYLYGLISHSIADAVIHPFMFYWSGFPDNQVRQEIESSREQNLYFCYNLDNYNILDSAKNSSYRLSIQDMIPVNRFHGLKSIPIPLKSLILRTVNEAFPAQMDHLLIKKFKEKKPYDASNITYLDFLPLLINISYKIKRTENKRIAGLMLKVRERKWFYSDFIIRYPEPRRINNHVLNFHKDRWLYPAGQIGTRYDSIENLQKTACEKTVDLWLAMEAAMYDKINDSLLSDLGLNSYTGERDRDYFSMKLKNPIKIKLQ